MDLLRVRPEAVIEVLKAFNLPITGKRAVIVGRSMVVGRPLSMLMLKENATVTICHTKTEDLKAVCQEADILVAAAGKAKMLDASFLKEGAVLIDVGINVERTENSAETSSGMVWKKRHPRRHRCRAASVL